MRDYLASPREASKSLACRNLCTIPFTLLLLCPDTGPAVRILGNSGALQKYLFRDGTRGKKVKLSFVILRTKYIFSRPNFRTLAINKGKLLQKLKCPDTGQHTVFVTQSFHIPRKILLTFAIFVTFAISSLFF